MTSTMKGAAVAVAVAIGAIVVAATALSDGGRRELDTSHSITTQAGMSSALAAVLTRSCGDCHSSSMVSRWYTRVPPFSVLMARGASEGRKSVDFSKWSSYSPDQQRAFLIASCADATAGSMPIKAYLRFRSEARLSREDVSTICSAVQPAPTTTATSRASRAEKTR